MDWDPPETWMRMATWLKELGDGLKALRPRGIVVISSHWEESEFTVMTKPRPSLYYDYQDFPEHTYHLDFQPPGDPALAAEVQAALQGAGIPCRADDKRDYDHGVFVPLKVAFPEADVPIIQLSLKKGLDAATHIAAGKALRGLRDRGVVILGSGMSYHNMRDFFGNGAALEPSKAFDDWLTSAATAEPEARDKALTQWMAAPFARRAHPREEHLVSLMVVAGAAGADKGVHVFQDTVMGAVVSAYRYG